MYFVGGKDAYEGLSWLHNVLVRQLSGGWLLSYTTLLVERPESGKRNPKQ